MRLRTWLAASLALAASSAVAQDWATADYCNAPPRPVTENDLAPHDLAELERIAGTVENGLGRFWKVDTPDAEASFVFGTSHVSNAAILDLPSQVNDAVSDARLVALETDNTFPDRASFLSQHDLPGRYRDPGDPFMGQDELDLTFLPVEAQEWVYDRLFGIGSFDDVLFVLTYGGLAELLMADPCQDYVAGTIPTQDAYIHTIAHIAGTNVVGMEKPGQILADLAEDEDTAKAILAVYASRLAPQTSSDVRAASLQLYIEGRLGLLQAWTGAQITAVLGQGAPQTERRANAYLIKTRNQRFLDGIESDLRVGGVFLAVNAAHLPGPNGLIAMLRQRGFNVTHVVLPGESE